MLAIIPEYEMVYHANIMLWLDSRYSTQYSRSVFSTWFNLPYFTGYRSILFSHKSLASSYNLYRTISVLLKGEEDADVFCFFEKVS